MPPHTALSLAVSTLNTSGRIPNPVCTHPVADYSVRIRSPRLSVVTVMEARPFPQAMGSKNSAINQCANAPRCAPELVPNGLRSSLDIKLHTSK